MLDAACGTGIDAAVLARRGFSVRAADGSQAMVEVAATRFRREGLAIAVQRCLWADLPAAIDGRFDVVLCTGNALVVVAPGAFDQFVAAAGEPAGELRLPEPVAPDPARITQLAAAHGIRILPPPQSQQECALRAPRAGRWPRRSWRSVRDR